MATSEDNPIRLASPGNYKRTALPTERIIVFPPPKRPSVRFDRVLAERRSAEQLGAVRIRDLGDWLFYTGSIQAINQEDHNRQRRYVASFGALHPTHILLGFPDGLWVVYLPAQHSVGVLPAKKSIGKKLRSKAKAHHDCPRGTLVALLSDYDLVRNYYTHASGLLLRDSGVLLGHAQLVAAALGLGFRILGSTGAPESEKLVPGLRFRPVATGLAWIGAPEQSIRSS